jgi:1,4-alpha-glucan branching enzyme
VGVYVARFEALRRLWGQFEKEFKPPPEDVTKSPHEVYLVSSGRMPERPVAVFTRDPETAIQVWSGEWGYPGDGAYLDFHKKRFPGGLRYWRVTSPKTDLADKRVYVQEAVEGRVRENSSHFISLIKEVLQAHRERTGRSGILTAPYDAELFGHWWFEGPRWLYHVLKGLDEDPKVELTTCSSYLEINPPEVVVSLPEGSWGEGGFHWIWLNEWTEWTWKHIYAAERRMVDLSRSCSGVGENPELERVLKQACRELLLLQASDWQFLISTWSARDYAEMRVALHAEDFNRLVDMAEALHRGEGLKPADRAFLEACEERDPLFPDVEPSWWSHGI